MPGPTAASQPTALLLLQFAGYPANLIRLAKSAVPRSCLCSGSGAIQDILQKTLEFVLVHAPSMSAPLPFGTVHQGPASHAEHCCLWISFRRVSINLHKCSAGAVEFEKVQP